MQTLYEYNENSTYLWNKLILFDANLQQFSSIETFVEVFFRTLTRILKLCQLCDAYNFKVQVAFNRVLMEFLLTQARSNLQQEATKRSFKMAACDMRICFSFLFFPLTQTIDNQSFIFFYS